MKITTAFGDSCEAKQVCVRMVKTLGVKVYFDYFDMQDFPGDKAGDKVSEEELEQMAHGDWLEAYAHILATVSKKAPHIDLELFSTDHVEVEVIE